MAVRDTATTPFLLDDAGSIWVIEQGQVDVYTVEIRGGTAAGPRRFLMNAEAPATLFGLAAAPVERPFGLVVVPAAGARVRRAPLAALRTPGTPPEPGSYPIATVDAFVTSVSAAIGRTFDPRLEQHLTAGQPIVLLPGQDAGSVGGVVWVRHDKGTSRFAGLAGAEVSEQDGLIPMAPGLWVTATDAAVQLTSVDSATAFSEDAGWAGVDRFRALVAYWLARYSIGVETADRERLRRKASADRQMRERGLAGLADILAAPGHRGPSAIGPADALLTACRAVGDVARIDFRPPPSWEVERKVRDPLASICRASRVRSRRVALRGRWWRGDHGPLLAFLAGELKPVALLPKGTHAYELYDPAERRRVMVDAATAATLDPFAFEFYRPLPDRRITIADLGRLIAAEVRADFWRMLLASLADGTLGLALPVAIGKIFSEIIPMAVPANILPLLAALVAMTLASTLFGLTRAFALTRSEARMNATLQAGIIDRLLALPVPFFRLYPVGDLAMRADAINSAGELLSGAAIFTLLTGAFSLVNVILLFYYSPTLALVAIAAVIVASAVTAGVALLIVRVDRRHQTVTGEIASQLFEMIGGIAKLRVAGAEGRAFAVWAIKFRDQHALSLQAGALKNIVKIFNDVLPNLAGLTLFAVAGSLVSRGTSMDTGQFVAFYAAFGTLFSAGIEMSNTMIELLDVVPTMERARPILDATVEGTTLKPDPGELAGHIEVSHVSFRYTPDGPLVLTDVNLVARPGEFVALVGPSGCGKSTLLRLLLGFETPESGAVYFDRQDLGLVDVSGVRAQMGVVLQSSEILAGDVFANIVGASPLTLDDAWAAAAMSGLADDIREMPMGMQTVISEGGSTLSGGQRQRLLITRALVRRPRILLFDEATSALDNVTQDTVSRSLEQMKATRIVIAHRLSTIRRAHRIYVMDHGQIVQEGTYEELARTPGMFAQLIARQLA